MKDKDRLTETEKEKKIDRHGSVMGEVDCDVLNESQISATYCIFTVQNKSVLSSLLAAGEMDFWEERRDNMERNFTSALVSKTFNL